MSPGSQQSFARVLGIRSAAKKGNVGRLQAIVEMAKQEEGKMELWLPSIPRMRGLWWPPSHCRTSPIIVGCARTLTITIVIGVILTYSYVFLRTVDSVFTYC